MKRVARVVLFHGLLALAFYAGYRWDGWMLFLFRGPAHMFVTTADITVGGILPDWQAGFADSPPCERPALGGIKAGTPVEMRHVGPLMTIVNARTRLHGYRACVNLDS